MLKIALAGRPNVGKSTLFNRLCHASRALVDARPGATRDWQSGEVVADGYSFQLIDTAGLDDGKAESLGARMSKNTLALLRRADAIFFLVDAREGLLPRDEDDADLIRALGCPTCLVINKCEPLERAETCVEAWGLGLGEPLALSAEHGLGMDDLMAVAKTWHETLAGGTEAAEPNGLRLAVLGRPNVGKSTLVNAMVGEQRVLTGAEAGITRDAVDTTFRWGDMKVWLFDTAGIARRRSDDGLTLAAQSAAFRSAELARTVILVVDVQAGFERQELRLCERLYQEGRALVIALNKWDLLADGAEKRKKLADFQNDIYHRVPMMRGSPLVPVSALNGKGLGALRRAVKSLQAPFAHHVATGPLNRWLQSALSRHAIPRSGGRAPRILFAAQTGIRPPTLVFSCSRVAAIAPSYRRYLAHDFRRTFKLERVPVRLLFRQKGNPYAGRASNRRSGA